MRNRRKFVSSAVGVSALAFGTWAYATTTFVTVQITNETLYQADPTVSGGRVAYAEYAGGTGDIVVYDIAAATRTTVAINTNDTWPKIDGSTVVFMRDDASTLTDIYAIDLGTMVEQ